MVNDQKITAKKIGSTLSYLPQKTTTAADVKTMRHIVTLAIFTRMSLDG